MRVLLQDLPPDRVRALMDVAAAPPEGVILLRRSQRWLGIVGVLALACGLASAWALLSGFQEWLRPLDACVPWAGLLGLAYGPVALAEGVRILASPLKAFILVTPFDLVRSRGGHRPLEIHPLAQARSFNRVEEYSGRNYTGLGYRFAFDGGEEVKFSLRRKVDQERTDAVLALARRAGRGEPLLDLPGCRLGSFVRGGIPPAPEPGLPGRLADPSSKPWLGLLGLLMIAFILYAFIR